MGARPIALLNSLRFGTLDDPATRRLVDGVVAGIAGYGNSIGIPTVGGEIAFEPSYAGNPLVNVFCLGVAKADRLAKGLAAGVGNPCTTWEPRPVATGSMVRRWPRPS